MRKTRFLKAKNTLLELEKGFIELKDRELKDAEVKIKRVIKDLFFRRSTVSIDNMDKSWTKRNEEEQTH